MYIRIPLNPASAIAACLSGSVDYVRQVLLILADSTPALRVLLLLAHMRLGRAVARIDRLAIRFAAGKLAKRVQQPRPHRIRGPGPGVPFLPTGTPVPYCPQGKAWLLKLAQPAAHLQAGLINLLLDPASKALIAAAPDRMGRILRPLARMIGYPLPPELQLPPRVRARKPRPQAAPKPVPFRPQPRPRTRDDIPDRHRLVMYDAKGRRHRYWDDWS